MNLFCCPVCGQALLSKERRLVCENGHSFDLARSGYVNLLNHPTAHAHGDDRPMLLARRAFLEKEHYLPLAEALAEKAEKCFPSGGVLLDAGCGEGYYLSKIASLLQSRGKSASLLGIDVSKIAVEMAAKREKSAAFAVASVFSLPLPGGCADLILSVFAPYAEEEFARVLKPGGWLLRAVPLEKHLFSLKKALYENPVLNTARAKEGGAFETVSEENIRYRLTLSDPADIRNLFEMTPYARKTGLDGRARLNELSFLETEAEFGLVLSRKCP